jgi:hypothetical protein
MYSVVFDLKCQASSHDRPGEYEAANDLYKSLSVALGEGAVSIDGVDQPKQVSLLRFRADIKAFRICASEKEIVGDVPQALRDKIAALFKRIKSLEEEILELDKKNTAEKGNNDAEILCS